MKSTTWFARIGTASTRAQEAIYSVEIDLSKMETFARVPVHVLGLVSVPTIEAPVFPLVQKFAE